MADDGYEFLGPDLLAPPPPPADVSNANPSPSNELAPSSTAEKFKVPLTKAGGKRNSSSDSTKNKHSADGKSADGKQKKGQKSGSRDSDPMPSLASFKYQMIFSGISLLASIVLVAMVLAEGLA